MCIAVVIRVEIAQRQQNIHECRKRSTSNQVAAHRRMAHQILAGENGSSTFLIKKTLFIAQDDFAAHPHLTVPLILKRSAVSAGFVVFSCCTFLPNMIIIWDCNMEYDKAARKLPSNNKIVAMTICVQY